jgi:hypothetical protein
VRRGDDAHPAGETPSSSARRFAMEGDALRSLVKGFSLVCLELISKNNTSCHLAGVRRSPRHRVELSWLVSTRTPKKSEAAFDRGAFD